MQVVKPVHVAEADSNESQKVVQAVKSPLKGLIVSFGSLTRNKEVVSAAGPDVQGGAEE